MCLLTSNKFTHHFFNHPQHPPSGESPQLFLKPVTLCLGPVRNRRDELCCRGGRLPVTRQHDAFSNKLFFQQYSYASQQNLVYHLVYDKKILVVYFVSFTYTKENAALKEILHLRNCAQLHHILATLICAELFLMSAVSNLVPHNTLPIKIITVYCSSLLGK